MLIKMPTLFFVHPGYLRRQDLDQKLIGSCRDNAEYGSYKTYLNNLQRLYSKTTAPRVFLVQLLQGQLHPYMEGFEPQKQDIVIKWEGKRIPILTCFVVLKQKKHNWEWEELLYDREFPDYLHTKGIEEIVLAGEMGPYELSKEGCVGAIYTLLKDDFKVQGVKDGIFPLIPYRKRITPKFKKEYAQRNGRKDTRIFREMENMFKDLYDKAVTL